MDLGRWISHIIILVQVHSCLGASPNLLSKSDDAFKIVGTDVHLTCEFDIKVQISWLKDNQPVKKSATVFTNDFSKRLQALTLKGARISDAGTYTCVGKNSDGEAKGDIKLDILHSKPKIKEIRNVYLKAGEDYVVECNAEGAIPLNVNYKWRKVNGRMDSTHVTDDGTGGLSIKNMVTSIEGNYTCTATNSQGSSEETFQLLVATVSKWLQRPGNKVVSTTEKFEWVASFVSLSAKPRFTWYKDGSIIMRTPTMTQAGAVFTSKLPFPDLNIGDAGKYRVNIDNLLITGFQTEMVLVVLAPPTLQIKEGAELREKDTHSISFTCIAEANPPPSMQWSKNGTVLLSQPANGTKTLTYHKKDIKKVDSGQYICSAFNSKGNGTVFINLIVEDHGLTTAAKITLSIVFSILIIFLIVVAVFVYLRFGERCIDARIDEGKFYHDLVEEEKDISCLEEMENNPTALKKNINASIRRTAAVNVIEKPSNKSIRRGFSLVPGKKTFNSRATFSGDKLNLRDRKGSVFDTIMMNKARKGSLFSTISRTLKGENSNSSSDNNYIPVGKSVCQGRPIEFKRIILDEIIGSGEYGMVTKGRLHEDDDEAYTDIAVKMSKDELKSTEKRNMLSELRVMRRVPSHPNIVEFIGWCLTSDDIYIIEEYMPFGNLLMFLRAQSHLQNTDVTIEDELPLDYCIEPSMLLSYARQIASGMMHLSSMQVIHRDLACRNVYLGYENTCKISDYALMRDIYTENVYRKTTGGQLPVRWMAPEAIFEGEYSSKSDVWSFGVLLWELVTLGKIPYPGIMRTEQLLEEIESGYHMENPGHISTDLYLLMDSCWKKNPDSRPKFSKLYAQLTEFSNDLDTVHVDMAGRLGDGRNYPTTPAYSPTEDFHRPPVFPKSINEEKGTVHFDEMGVDPAV